MAAFTQSFDAVAGRAMRAWKPPPRLSLSEWADREFVLSAESAAEPGRWRTIPYQRGMLDAFSDPEVEEVSVMKSARIGWTKIVDILVAYCIVQDPCPIMVVQPTVEDAEGYSKEEIAPMMRDVPAVRAVVGEIDSEQTILHKQFPGGSVSFVGANSARGFRRTSRKVVLFDETDGYPPTAGTEGDQIKLGKRRTEYYWDRKIGAGSTPTIAGASRIEKLFKSGDQRRFYVPCPHCGHFAPLVFREGGEIDGHTMKWPEGKPEDAYFECQKNKCVITHDQKRGVVEQGEWRAHAPFVRHASFHIWAAYSYSPNATWGQIATEFVEANALGPDVLQTFVNTVLGEVWAEKGEAPDHQRLYERRELYQRGTVPSGAMLVTAGVDVQRDRLVFEVVAWGNDRQSWSIDAGILPGDPANETTWYQVDDLLSSQWPGEDGRSWQIRALAVDSGDNTQSVYNWGRTKPLSRVIATKGDTRQRALIGAPSPVDVNYRGKRLARGYKVWPIGVDLAKSEFYGWLRLPKPDLEKGEAYPPGFCHFPEYGTDYFQQITAEHLVKRVDKKGFAKYAWEVIPGRENHWLDCRVLARVAATHAGLDRHAVKHKMKHGRAPPPVAPVAARTKAEVLASAAESAQAREVEPLPVATTPPAARPPRRRGTWLQGAHSAKNRGFWNRR